MKLPFPQQRTSQAIRQCFATDDMNELNVLAADIYAIKNSGEFILPDVQDTGRKKRKSERHPAQRLASQRLLSRYP